MVKGKSKKDKQLEDIVKFANTYRDKHKNCLYQHDTSRGKEYCILSRGNKKIACKYLDEITHVAVYDGETHSAHEYYCCNYESQTRKKKSDGEIE